MELLELEACVACKMAPVLWYALETVLHMFLKWGTPAYPQIWYCHQWEGTAVG